LKGIEERKKAALAKVDEDEDADHQMDWEPEQI
jgi:hypothetical protein